MQMKPTLTASSKKLELLNALLLDEGLHEQKTAIPVRHDRAGFVTSFTQQRLWFLDQLDPGSATYNVSSAVKLEGVLDVPLLERSLNDVAQRHETLRTRFDLGPSGQPQQIVLPEVDIRLPIVQVPSRGGESESEVIEGFIRTEASAPFDLKNGPLIRAQLLKVDHLQHIALFTMHHIICDGWSQEVLVRDLVHFYNAYVHGSPGRMKPLAIQYGDYAEWQRALLQGEALAKELDYWRGAMDGLGGVLELPTDRPRPTVQTFRGEHHELQFSPDLTSSLNDFARREKTTPYIVLLASLQVLLWRYSGQNDIAVGTPVANRRVEETHNLIGFFANTLVMRSKMHAEESFRSFLRRVQETALGAYEHQEMPFETLVEDLNPKRDLSRSPLFQVMFSFENESNKEPAMAGLKLTMLPSANNTAKFDLLIGMEQAGDVLRGAIEYATDLFDESTAVRMGQHWQALLKHLLDRPDSIMADLELLTEEERHEMISDWNQTVRQYPTGKVLPEQIEEQSERTPNAVAVVFGPQKMTYAELNSRANQIAHSLRRKGIRQEHLVGIYMERSLEMVAALLAILKAGAAYVPLDPGYPGERLAFMLKDSGASLLLTQEHLMPVPLELDCETLCLDADWNVTASEPANNPRNLIPEDSLAYVIYTSGSTGQPKGAMNSHGGIRNRLQWMQEQYLLDETDCVLQKTPFSFDVSVWEFFWPLAKGARLVLARPGGHQDPSYLASLIQDESVTTTHFVPSMLQAFLDEPAVEQCRSLRRVFCSGEALTCKLQERFLDRMSHVDLHNLYGPTEAAVDVTWWRCVRGEKNDVVPLGRPIANMQIHILDQRMHPVPIGVIGEIYIGGAGLGRGYWRRPELTADRFVPNPFSDKAGSRLYRTGDIGRYRLGGVIEFLGRRDHQVKIRGFRVELGEIEKVLSAFYGVREAVVIAQQNESENTKLVAYVVLKDLQEKPKADQLRQHLRKYLPDHMVPNIIVEIESLPLFPNGKLDRRALPKASAERVNAFAPPITLDEKMLATIWSDVLKLDQIGIDDNFFTIGGDSILSIQIRARAQMAGFNFSLQDLFRHQTIRDLARHRIADLQEEVLRTEPFSLVSEEDRRKFPDFIEDAYPLAALQLGMLFHQEFAPSDAIMYHNVNSYHVRGVWNREIFLVALQLVTARHPVLRTSFDFENFSVPLQLVHRNTYFPVEEVDLRELADSDQELALQEFMAAARQERFILSQPPQLRFHIHRRSNERFQFTFTENHAIVDGWSLHATLAEIFGIYGRLIAGQSVTAEPALQTTYRDFIAREKLDVESEEHRRFWMRSLEGAEYVPIPDSAAYRTPKREPRVVIRNVEISQQTSDGLKRLSQSLGVPIKSLLLAAHMKAMSVITGCRDVVSGLVTNGRLETEDGDQVRGLFLNTIPFRLMIAGGTVADLVNAAFAAEREILPHRRYPLSMIQRTVGVEDIFDSYFNFAHFHVVGGVLESGGFEILGGNKYEATNLKLYAAFSISPIGPHDIWLELQYDDSRVSHDQSERITHCYAEVLKAFAADAQVRHTDISFLTSADRLQLHSWNQVRADCPTNETLVQRFESRVTETPRRPAVLSDDTLLNYGELQNKVSQLSSYLRKKGVGPEMLVGICTEPTVETVIAVIAVLETGAAYVPIVPDDLPGLVGYPDLTLLLTQKHLTKSFQPVLERCIWLDRDWHLIAQESFSQAGQYDSSDESLACVLRGSEASNVMVQQASLASFAAKLDAVVGSVISERWLTIGGLSLVIPCFELVWPLLHGAQIILCPGDATTDPAWLLNEIKRHDVTCLHCTPSMMSALLYLPGALEVLQRLKKLLLEGELLSSALALDLQKITGCKIINLHGHPEATTWFNHPLPLSTNSHVVVQRPPGDTKIYILDGGLHQQPIGIAGEIYLAGEGLARGYFARPDLTAGRFLPDPFSDRPGDRMFRSGDLGQYRADGSVEYLGEADLQVSIGGRRVSLVEVERVLTSHRAVSEAVVTVQQEASSGSKRLLAYVVSKCSEESGGLPLVDAVDLKDHLHSLLPSYMVPAVIMPIDRMPLTSIGTLDREALPRPHEENWNVRRSSYLAPQTATEEILSNLWKSLLLSESIGIRDNFFDLGGDSLSATQLVARVRNIFRVEIELRQLFDHPTIEGLALRIDELLNDGLGIMLLGQNDDEGVNVPAPEQTSEPAPTVRFSIIDKDASPPDHVRVAPGMDRSVPTQPNPAVNFPTKREQSLGLSKSISRRDPTERVALSFAQQRLWFLNLLEPDSAFYNLPVALMLEGDLDLAALERALDGVVQKHEVLRTRFEINPEGEPEQVVLDHLPIKVPVVELPGETEQQRLLAANQLAVEEASRPFDLKTGPLLRVRLLRIRTHRHVALFTLHHIISDQWSQGILIEEIGKIYGLITHNQQPAFDRLPIQYADFSTWQRKMLQGEFLEKQIGYWRKQLAGSSGVLSVPADHPRPPVQTFSGATYRLVLELELGARVRGLAQQGNATLFMTLLAAFNVLLWRYSGQKDLVVGSPIANRTMEETEGVIGLFANTLVLRTQIEDSCSFRELVRQVRNVVLEASAHQDLPFEKLVEELNPERDLSRTPLFQVLFTLQNARPRLLHLPGLRVEGVEAENLTSKFDLTMAVNESVSGELESSIEYNTDLFDRATIVRMAGHWRTLLRNIIRDPDKPVADLSILPDPECQQILVGWNQTERSHARETTLIRSFEEQAAQYPNRLAVIFDGNSVTFGELNQRANQLARYLQSKGAGLETPIAICIERGIEMMVGLLAIWKAGAAYVPLDPGYPAERLQQMLEDCGAELILTQKHLATTVRHIHAELVCIDQDWPNISSHGSENLSFSHPGDSLAYIIYTSGSTGKPKGVMVRHSSLTNLVFAMDDCIGLESPGTWLAVTSLSFDISIVEVFWTLSRGFRVVLQPGVFASNLQSVLKQIERHEVTHFQCTPSMAGLLLLDNAAVKVLARLKKMLVGGEALPYQVARRLQQIVGGQVINLYGPTETTIWSSSWHLHEAISSISIGKPLANTQFYILNETLDPVPIGAIGELYIGGDGLARGYFARPDLTADRFVPDHLSGRRGDRLYRTGDLAKYQADGNVEYQGRTDQQVKLRGHRIELEEIESQLAAHELVREAAVVLRQGQNDNSILVAYITLKEQSELTSQLFSAVGDLLRTHLRDRLPEYMVPAMIVELDQMPLTVNGKLDRRALPKPQQVSRPQDHTDPRNEVELKIASAWKRVLGVEQIGVYDNFFDIGGHSLLLAKLSIELSAELGHEIAIVDLFRYASVAEFSEFLGAAPAETSPGGSEAATAKLEAAKDRLKKSASRRQMVGMELTS
jgi:amino acid adenylation domain-containing protein